MEGPCILRALFLSIMIAESDKELLTDIDNHLLDLVLDRVVLVRRHPGEDLLELEAVQRRRYVCD